MSKKVLIIDDEPDSIYVVEEILSELEGVETISAENGKRGLEKAREEKPNVIILDVQMPDMTGFEVFSHLTKDEELKHIPVVMFTGVSKNTGIGFSSDEMKSFLGKEPAAYLEKPVSPELLQKTIKDIVTKKD